MAIGFGAAPASAQAHPQAVYPEDVIVDGRRVTSSMSREGTDVLRLERLVAEGRMQLARRRPSECARLLSEAEGLWRGPAYSEVRDEPFARAEATPGGAAATMATETRIDAELTMGRREAVAGELEMLTSANPMRERLWSQRMLALYRCGRQAEALRVFQDLRAVLVDELGIEPGHDVSWLEHAVLAQDPTWTSRPRQNPMPAPPPRLRQPHRRPSTRSGYRRLEQSGRWWAGLTSPGCCASWWTSVGQGAGRLLLIDGDPGNENAFVVDLAQAVEADGALALWGRSGRMCTVAPFRSPSRRRWALLPQDHSRRTAFRACPTGS